MTNTPAASVSPTHMSPEDRVRSMLALLTAECGALTEPEKKLARAVVLGEECDVALPGQETLTLETEHAAWHAWGAHRSIRSKVIRAICVRPEAHALANPWGVILTNARITGVLNIDGARVPFDLWFARCAFDHPIAAQGATVRTLSFGGSRVPGLKADRMQAFGNIRMGNGFKATGGVSMLGSSIVGDVDCSGGCFDNAAGDALNVDGVDVTGDVFLNRCFCATGVVKLTGARIRGDLSCESGVFTNRKAWSDTGTKECLRADGIDVAGTLYLRGASFTGVIDFTSSRVGTLVDEPGSDESGQPLWPEWLLLDGFRYGSIHAGSPLDAKRRLAWLANHDETLKQYRTTGTPPDPGPYRTLAAVLRTQGHERDADAIMEQLGWIRMRPLLIQRRQGTIGERRKAYLYWIGSWLYGRMFGHGYARFRPLAWLAGFWIVGAIVFAFPAGQTMQPTQALALKTWSESRVLSGPSVGMAGPVAGTDGAWLSDYPKFNPLVYSLDAFLPLVDFHQEEHWTPRSGPTAWRWLVKTVYLPLHIMSGWVIATLFAASFTRLARQD